MRSSWALELKGLALNIEDAAIRTIRIGSCRAKASVKCEKITLIEGATKEPDLPGRRLAPRYPNRAAAVRRHSQQRR